MTPAFALLAAALAQEPAMHAGTLAHALDRLATTSRVLYVAAHPDDENTRLLAYLANARHVTAAYLSMTRGGGGQNLIGREQAELLDVVRTEELLAARRLDGAQQRFTRMRDFGYSKSAQETFETWGHDEALADVVWVIRTFRPDVVITRFNENPPNHGHHTASAVLAREAVAAAADPARFPDQLARGGAAWTVTRLLLNVPGWRNDPPPPDALVLDVGGYDARLGMSYGELAAGSRSQHKSQGFGVPGERGPLLERFVTIAGSKPERDVLEGVAAGWERFGAAGRAVGGSIDEARKLLDVDHPERAVPPLVEAYRALGALPDDPRVRDAKVRVVEAIEAASGLFLRATSPQPAAVPGGTIKVSVEAILRRPAALSLAALHFPGAAPLTVGQVLTVHEKKEFAGEARIAADAPVFSPYWLAQPPLAGRFAVADLRLVGAPKGEAPLAVVAMISAGGTTIPIEVPVRYVWTDPVEGERVRDVLVAPPATVTPAREAVLLPNGESAEVALRVRAARDALEADVVLPVPSGWRAEPAKTRVTLAKTGDETTLRFTVTAPKGAGAISVAPAIEVAGRAWSVREDVVDHPHIPMQVVLQPSSVRLVPLSIRVPKGEIGYIQGSGDSVPDDLGGLGMTVSILDDDTLRGGDLSRYRAIVVGIRAYNTRAPLRAAHERLMRYVENGGTVVVQYNTASRVGPLEGVVGPYPLVIGRGRVTDETAAMSFVAADHELLHRPNRIGPADFEGWVQERGLYFAETWDPKYAPILTAADPGEQALQGGLLFARHGRGRYVYTGLAFFRQLPAGVPGAYRLFVNLLGGE